MSTPQPIGNLIPQALRELERLPSLAARCAALDKSNPQASEHWNYRAAAMLAIPGGSDALAALLREALNRLDPVTAKARGFKTTLSKPGAWLNAQSLAWFNAHKPTNRNPRRF